MSEDNFLAGRAVVVVRRRQRPRSIRRDFQLEVLGRLAEMQSASEGLEGSLDKKIEAITDRRLLKFDSRALIALGAIGLSVTGYVIQDARSTARQDNEIQTTKARVLRLEQIAATNTEGRIRTEVQLGELREGQTEIKNTDSGALPAGAIRAVRKTRTGRADRICSRPSDHDGSPDRISRNTIYINTRRKL